MALSKGIFYSAAAVGFIGLAVGLNSCSSQFHPESQGADFLKSEGYEVVGGGERDYFNGCGKNVTARSYEVRRNSGEIQEKTVCFGLFGPRFPLFGG